MPLAFFSSMVLMSSAMCAPAAPRGAGSAGAQGHLHLPGKCDSPGIKGLPAGKPLVRAGARPAVRAVEAGAVLSCRGLGKCVLRETPGQSKKGRTMVLIERFL